MDFSKLQQPHPSEACQVEYYGQTLVFKFDHNKLTARRLSDMQADIRESGNIDVMAAFLADVLIEWDMTDGGKPAAINEAFLVELPQPLVSAMFAAIMEATGGGKQPTENRNGSRPSSRERRKLAQAGR